MEDLPTLLIRLKPGPDTGLTVSAWEERLRQAPPCVIAVVRDNTLYLDLRTVQEQEEDDLVNAVIAAAEKGSRYQT